MCDRGVAGRAYRDKCPSCSAVPRARSNCRPAPGGTALWGSLPPGAGRQLLRARGTAEQLGPLSLYALPATPRSHAGVQRVGRISGWLDRIERASQRVERARGGECLPADNSINTGPSEIILDKSPRLCHREMDASPQSRWLLGSGEGTRTESRVPAAAIGARTGGERALAEATGTSPARE